MYSADPAPGPRVCGRHVGALTPLLRSRDARVGAPTLLAYRDRPRGGSATGPAAGAGGGTTGSVSPSVATGGGSGGASPASASRPASASSIVLGSSTRWRRKALIASRLASASSTTGSAPCW